jgi:hypothetical protein
MSGAGHSFTYLSQRHLRERYTEQMLSETKSEKEATKRPNMPDPAQL